MISVQYLLSLLKEVLWCPNTEFSVPNTEKHRPEKTLYLDKFYKVTVTERSKKEKKAAVKLWLAKRKFEIKDGIMGKS